MRLLILTWETKCQNSNLGLLAHGRVKTPNTLAKEKKSEPIATEVARCFNCNSPKHVARDCPEKKNVSKNKPYTVKQCLVVDRFNRDVSLETSFEKLTDVVDCALRTQCGGVNRVSNVDELMTVVNVM